MGEIILLMCNLQLGRKALKIIWKPAIKIEGGGGLKRIVEMKLNINFKWREGKQPYRRVMI